MPWSRQTCLNGSPSLTRLQIAAASSGVYLVSVNSTSPCSSSRAYANRAAEAPFVFCDGSEPIENGADRPLDGVGVIALEPVQETAGNQPIDIGIADLNHEASEPALAPVA
jgi:hypothetical protein